MEYKNIIYGTVIVVLLSAILSAAVYVLSPENGVGRIHTYNALSGKAEDREYSFPLPSGSIVPIQNKDANSVVIYSFGDLMLDRSVRVAIEKQKKDPFVNMASIAGGNDLVLANLEGSFTDFKPKPVAADMMTFTFNPKMAPALKKSGINVLNLANNHALNFGKKGFEQSKKYLKDAGIDYFGDPLNMDEISFVKEIKGKKIGFVGYSEFGTKNLKDVIETVKSLNFQVDFLIVYTHWGVEYKTKFTVNQQEKAHQFIDAGADVVIGSHPHVIEPVEIYNNKPIFYSLGNFLFDQVFSVQTQQGLGIKIVLSADFKGQSFTERTVLKAKYYLVPTQIKNFEINLPAKEKRDMILKDLAASSSVSDDIKRGIEKGELKFGE